MKKMTYFVMALAMVLGFTQCKKEQIATTENEGEKVTITLKLNNGSRGHIVPGENTAAVVYDNGDIIMVGLNGAYVGDLSTTDGHTFSGDVNISGAPTDGKIYFYYLDGKSQSVNSGKCFVNISDQTSGLPVISYACVDYSSSNTYSNVKMRNQCGLVKFNTTDVAGAITISGVNNQMEVDFTAHSFTPKNPGSVTLNGTSGTTRWAILLPQDEGCSATVTAVGYNDGTCDVPVVTNNMYYTTGVEVSLTAAAAVGHALSVSVLGEVVGTDGLAYAVSDKDNLPTGVTAAGMVAYKDGSNGLVIALTDEASTMVWSTAMGENGAAAHTPAVSGQAWKLPSADEWYYMIYPNLNTDIGNAGGTALPENIYYWTSTLYYDDRYLNVYLNDGSAQYSYNPMDWPLKVRACFAF